MHDRKSLAIVGAHIGDCEVMAGGIAVKASEEGRDVHLIHMTGGEKGHPNLPPQEYLKQKKKEAEEFADRFGFKVHFMPYGDGELEETVEVKTELADLFRAVRPLAVLTHWRGSFHKDHIATYNIVLDATFYAGNRWSAIKGKPCSSRVFFAENWEDKEDFQPEIYVDVSPVLDKWVEALRKIAFARGETGFNYIDYYTSLARMRGLEMGVKYAETLMRPLYSRRITITQLDEL